MLLHKLVIIYTCCIYQETPIKVSVFLQLCTEDILHQKCSLKANACTDKYMQIPPNVAVHVPDHWFLFAKMHVHAVNLIYKRKKDVKDGFNFGYFPRQ